MLIWITVFIYVFSGIHDLFYDIANYIIRLYRKTHFRGRTRLSLTRLRTVDEQHIAIFVPAWSEAEVIDKMIDNIVRRVEYHRYVIFVGTYPNDPATQGAVDALAAIHTQVIKVVTARPGPTSKADCLNNIYDAMERYEESHHIRFDIVAMHDAEDFVHPYELLLFNYLIPRVDAVQTPILPLPVDHTKWVHWVYADEFAENHMKDVPVREKTSGFVPFAGVATGFSRRGFRIIQEVYGSKIFNEESLTEDYSLGKHMRDLGLRTVFVNVILKDDKSPWYRPLCQRTNFIASWAYFPMDFKRSVRQKTRWITGISFQEWQQTGWSKDFWMNENLFKDRKGAIAYLFTVVGYFLFLYFVVYQLGQRGIVPYTLVPLVKASAFLSTALWLATGLMFVRGLQRIVIVTWVYGIVPGLLSAPRQFLANIINGLASYFAILTYAKQRWRGEEAKWEKTEHKEGVGAAPIEAKEVEHLTPKTMPFMTMLERIYAHDVETIVSGVRQVTPQTDIKRRKALKQRLFLLITHPDFRVRAALPRAITTLGGENIPKYLLWLLCDRDWIVRTNTARAIVDTPVDTIPELLKKTLSVPDYYGRQVMLHAVENRADLTELLRLLLDRGELSNMYDWLMANSILLRHQQVGQEIETVQPVASEVPVAIPAVLSPHFTPAERGSTLQPAGHLRETIAA